MQKEIWIHIGGYEDLYQVSNLGNVRKPKKIIQNKNGSYSIKNSIEVRQVEDSYGYLRVTLTKNGKSKQAKVHRLVSEAFIPNPDNKEHINHIDGDKWNNNMLNLEWCTSKENTQHAYASGLKGNLPKYEKQKIYYTEIINNIIAKVDSSLTTGNNFDYDEIITEIVKKYFIYPR